MTQWRIFYLCNCWIEIFRVSNNSPFDIVQGWISEVSYRNDLESIKITIVTGDLSRKRTLPTKISKDTDGDIHRKLGQGEQKKVVFVVLFHPGWLFRLLTEFRVFGESKNILCEVMRSHDEWQHVISMWKFNPNEVLWSHVSWFFKKIVIEFVSSGSRDWSNPDVF